MKTTFTRQRITRAVMTLLVTMLTAATAWAQTTQFPTASGGSGTSEDPYKISSTDDLDKLAADVNSGTKYVGVYFELTTNITYTGTENNYTPIGHYPNYFAGKFDGKGYTISGIRVSKNGDGTDDSELGVFGYVNGNDGLVEIKNITLANTQITGYSYCAGIVGYAYHEVTITNCHVGSDVTIHAVKKDACSHGGIVGRTQNDASTISGCTSAATISIADGLSGCKYYGGIVGDNNGTIKDCLVLNAKISGNSYVGSIAGNNNNTLGKFVNCGYVLYARLGVGDNSMAGSDQTGAQFVEVSSEEPASIGSVTTTYGTGITAYENGLKYGDKYYTPAAKTDLWGFASGADGSQDHPYVITSTDGLDMLAQQVNYGIESFKNKYIELGSNITYSYDGLAANANNYTPIGYYDDNLHKCAFLGHFDGKGHTISGIRIRSVIKMTKSVIIRSAGVFGFILDNNAEVKNVTLDDTEFTDGSYFKYDYIGGIVGIIGNGADRSIISNCHVTSSVTMSKSDNCGGIAGWVQMWGSISGCTSAATVIGISVSGGIVGLLSDGTIKDCLYLGSSVTATERGAIVGKNKYGSVTNCYYTTSGLGGVNGADTDGARDAGTFNTLPVGIGDEGETYGESTYTGITAYANGLKYNDTYYTTRDPNMEYDINGIGNVTNGSIAASISGTDVSKAKANDVVTLTATPSDGYTLIDLSVVDGSSNAVAVDWNIWTNTATFTMPASAVTVTPTFTNDLTSLYINMPATGTKTATIPSGVTSFKVYDDGGASGNYSSACSGTLVLTAPEGYVLQLSGSIRTEIKADLLTVYDNSEASGTKLLDAVSGTQTAITTVTSTGKSMTLYFYSGNSYNLAGLNLTVEVLKTLELANYADNTDAIDNNNNGMMPKVTLSDRTLLKNGDWNTLCLPFSLTAEQIAASPLAGATIKELLTSSNLDSEGKLTLNFKDATAIAAGKPYMVKWDNTPALTISSAAEWETFASNVNDGTESYEGKVVKLNADISVSTMVGTVTSGNAPENAFKGIFDGGGHTIDVNINSTDRHATAPFRYIKDATIMDVRTTGTVTGTMHCAGLVGFSEGTSYIKNCEVNVAVICGGSSHSHCGGILGHGKSSTTTVSDCLFSGSISNATDAVGIIYGWGDNSTHTIVNCLAAGTYTGCSGVDLLKKDKGTEVITNCYKTENVGSQGTYTTATGDDLVTKLGDGWVNNGGSVVPKMGVGYVPANLTNPVFKNVTIDKTMNDVSFSGGSFKGTYAPLEIKDYNRDEVLLLAAGNKLGYAKTDRTVANGKALGTCRAYFEITGAAAVRSFIMDFGDEQTTGITTTNAEPSTNEGIGWYDLSGRRLQGKPTEKGVYIQNGKKTIIK